MVHNARSYDYDPPYSKAERCTRSPRTLSSDRPGPGPAPMPLHNFTLPRLGWGCQKLMRSRREVDCSMSPSSSSGGGRRLSVLLPRDQARFMDEEEEEEEEEGVEDVRVKLMLDLRTETGKFKEELLKGKGNGDDGREEEEETVEIRPWNLRTRRTAYQAQGASDGSPARKVGVSEKRRDKFSVALKGKEIEEDFIRMTGHRPHRRPRKRNKSVQKQLDMLFPGLWLTEVTAEVYKVVEAPNNNRRGRE